jgi:hypothetical protein
MASTDRTSLNQARAALANARVTLTKALQNDAVKAAARDAAQRRFAPGVSERTTAEAEAVAASAALASAQSDERARRQDLAQAIANWLANVSAADDLARIASSVPAVLFPVRLETRFDLSVNPAVLKVRIYPDEIWVNQHESALTQGEVDAAKQYYLDREATGSDGKEQWRQLLTKMSANRAAYVLRVMTPTFGGGSSGSFTSGASGSGGGGMRFPDDILLRPETWTRPAEALMPDRFIVYTTRNGVTSTPILGKPIPEPLPTTVDPNVPLSRMTQVGTDGYQIDDDIAWTVDFDRAEAIGMAIRIPLTTAQAATDGTGGFDKILVIGVKTSLDPLDASVAIESLLDAHHYTRGLSLVAQGTPTNNTQGSPTPYPPEDPEGSVSFAIERENPPTDRFHAHPDLSSGYDGYKLAKLLGVPSGVLRNVDGARGSEEENARFMNRALWPATLGYFMEDVMSPVFDTAAHDAGRSYFTNNVRARGPVSNFRVGAVPYGVLPRVSIARWAARGTSSEETLESKMITTLRTLFSIWKQAVAKVNRVSRTTTDPLGDLLKVLATYPSSREVRVRTATGSMTTYNLAQTFPFDFVQFIQAVTAIANSVLARIGHPEWAPRVREFTYDSGASLYSGVLVAPNDQLSNSAPLVQNYLTLLYNGSAADLLSDSVAAGDGKQTLLYKAVRHAALVEYARAARAEAARRNLSTAIVKTEVEFWFIHKTTTTPLTLADIFALPVGSTTLGALIITNNLVSEFRSALYALQSMPTLELERLVTETLDLASHRIDAWLTALATRRLRELRTAQEDQFLAPVGTLIGGYGWVLDLRPASRHMENRPGAGNVEIAENNGGFVHAPSMAHAAAAAVLRSGHLSYKSEDPAKYAIDLSSARTRAARGLLDEIRSGLSLGAVLGYRFERGLHDRAASIPNIDSYRYELRRLYPLVAKKSGEVTTDAADTIAARNVVDGLALWTAARQNQVPFSTSPNLPRPNTTAYNAIQAEIAQLAESVDALMDLTTAESVFQLVRGNVGGASATLDALANGARPPDPEIARSVRGGTGLTHRVPLILEGDSAPALPTGWPAATRFALAEPFLDAWAGRLMGDPRDVAAKVTSADDTGATSSKLVTLDQLGLRPLDLIVLARGATEANQGSLLDRWLAFAAIGDDPLRSITDVDYARTSPSGRTFPEIMELARAIGSVIGGARALGADDFALPVETPDQQTAADTAALDAATELLARATAARADMANVSTTLANKANALAAAPDDIDARSALRAALRSAAGYLPGSAYPAPRMSSEELLASAKAVGDELGRRLAADSAVEVPDASGKERVKAATKRLVALFGRELRVLPSFVAPAAPELEQALGGQAALLGGDDNAPQKFLQQAAMVRPSLGRWRQLSLYTGALGIPRARLDVMQLPFLPDERWAGLPFTEDQRPASGRVSFLTLTPGNTAPTPSATWRGLLLDEWVEIIPSVAESTAVAFHYDNPGAEAGQAVLVAVPAKTGSSWLLDDLVGAVDETIDLAKVRAVDSELLDLGHLLPAIFFTENNQPSHTASTTWFGSLFQAVTGITLGQS